LHVFVLLGACSESPPDGHYLDASKVSVGECFWRRYPDAPEWSIVKVIPCDEDRWQFAVLSRFVVEASDDGPFPGDAFFAEEAAARCEEGWTAWIAPIEESWEEGFRDVICLMEPGGNPLQRA
jgi:hypothetical protein